METEKKINNRFYEHLHEGWYEDCQHPIALLRAENAVRNPWIIHTIQDYNPGACQILDVGCGAGLLTNALAKEGHEVTGIDISPSSLAQAQQKDLTKTVQYLCASAEVLPFGDQTFDVVCAMDFLEHVENPCAIIQEISRVLKPKGLFFFHTFNRTLWSYLLVIKCVEWFLPNVPEQMHVYPLFIKPDELKTYCQQVHLQIQFIQGLMPDLKCLAFWQSLIQRKVTPDFRFCFTSSLKTGYVGFATRI